MDEARLWERLRLIEALHAGAATQGERMAAEKARERIRERLEDMVREEEALEFRFSLSDVWSRSVFVALLRRYGLEPYRYKRQRRTTVMVRAPRSFVEETLWPAFEEISRTLEDYLSEVTSRVIAQVLGQDVHEADVVDDRTALPGA